MFLGKGGKIKELDYRKYLTLYSNNDDCGTLRCAGIKHREHYHCVDCSGKVSYGGPRAERG